MAGMMPRPIPPGVVEIDDSRLRDMWARHQQRSLFTARAVRRIGVAAVLGIAAVLAAIALAFWALERKPPVVNVQPAEVNVTVPEQKAPEVHVTPNINVQPAPAPQVNVYPNITVSPPALPAPTPLLPQVPPPVSPPTNKVVTEYTIFHNNMTDGTLVQTGWNYHNSNDTVPYMQYCYWYPNPSQRRYIEIGRDGGPADDLAQQTIDAGVTMDDALRHLTYCTWVGGGRQ